MNKKLYRDEYHKVLGGVCAGLAEYFEIDVTVIRLLFAFSFIIMGVGLIPYIVLWIVLPKKGYLYNEPMVDYTVPPQAGEGFTYGNNRTESSAFKNAGYDQNPFEGRLPKKRSSVGIIFGMVLIFVGGALLIEEYDLIPDFDFGRLWPIALVLVGASLIVMGQKNKPWHSDDWQRSANNSTETTSTPFKPADNAAAAAATANPEGGLVNPNAGSGHQEPTV